LLLAVAKSVSDARLNEVPAVYLTDDVQGGVRAHLEKTALALRCRLVRSEEEASHVVMAPAKLTHSRTPRTVTTVGGHTEVHWSGTPDSHNSLVPTASLPGDAGVDAGSVTKKQWTVCAQWLSDSGKYNEIMNPGDYQSDGALPRLSDEAFLDAVSVDLDSGGKRKREDASSGSAAKRPSNALRNLPQPDAEPKVTQVEDTHPEATRERPSELKPPRNPEIQKILSAGAWWSHHTFLDGLLLLLLLLLLLFGVVALLPL
jgi:hypothetical protein